MSGPVLTRRLALGLGGMVVLGGCSEGPGRARAQEEPPAVPRTRTATGDRPTIEVVSRERSGRVERWRLRSDAVPDETGATVVLPADYDDAPERRYPVLYLLHGSDGDEGWWTRGVDLPALVGTRPVILVMPDGGRQGWYVDWAGDEPSPRWESFHVRAVVPAVDATYRTHATRDGRALVGASMGGFGALHYLQSYPETFAAATALSGAVSLRTPLDFAAMDARPMDGKPAYAIFGRDGAAERVARVDPVGNVPLLTGRVRLYCGDGVLPSGSVDQLESAMLAGNRQLASRAQAAGVRLQVLHGGHDFGTWGEGLRQDLPGLLAALTPSR